RARRGGGKSRRPRRRGLTRTPIRGGGILWFSKESRPMATNSLSSISQDQFLQLLVAQLQNQDPLDPVSNKDLLAQLAQFSTLQGVTQLNANFGDLLQLQQLT